MDKQQVADYLHTLPAATFGLGTVQDITCERILAGMHHLNFKATISGGGITAAFVVRFPTKKEEAEALQNEHWYIHLLDPSVTPESVFYTDKTSFGLPLLITRFAPGKHIRFNSLTDVQIRHLAAITHTLHSVHRDKFSVGDAMLPTNSGTVLDYTKLAVAEFIDKRYREVADHVPHDQALFKQARRLLEDRLQAASTSWLSSRFSLCHGDIGDGNVLWEGNTPRLIDWDGANFGDPANEIGYIFAINNVSEDWRRTFLTAYLQHDPESTVIDRIDTHILKNRLADVVWSIGKMHEAAAGSVVGLTTQQSQELYEERRKNLQAYLDKLAD